MTFYVRLVCLSVSLSLSVAVKIPIYYNNHHNHSVEQREKRIFFSHIRRSFQLVIVYITIHSDGRDRTAKVSNFNNNLFFMKFWHWRRRRSQILLLILFSLLLFLPFLLCEPLWVRVSPNCSAKEEKNSSLFYPRNIDKGIKRQGGIGTVCTTTTAVCCFGVAVEFVTS